MITKVTQKWLKSQNPCTGGFAYWVRQKKPDLFDFIKQCIEDDNCDWASWLIARCMNRKQHLRYALYATKKLETIDHTQNSENIAEVIRVIKDCIKDDSTYNRSVAAAVYNNTSFAAANVAAATNVNANSSSDYAHAAAYHVAITSTGDYKDGRVMYRKLLRYGMRIMKEKQKCARR